MAKQRSSVFSTGTPKKQIAKEAKQIERAALEPDKPVVEKRRKHLYVDEKHHAIAKVSAARKGMKLSDYIEFLIEQAEQ